LAVSFLAAQVFSLQQAPAARDRTVAITLQQAEERFLKNNLQLLAARFNIDAAKAAVVQAELLEQSKYFNRQNAYNKFTKRYFDVTKTGNTDIQLQQLILLAGKRDKQNPAGRDQFADRENSFYDLLRALKF